MTGPVVQGPGVDWQRPASWSFFDPTLLSCAKKRGVEPPRRSCFRCAYRATEQKGCDPFDIPGVLISNCYPVERFYGFRQHSRSGLQLQTSLQLVQRSTCRAANMAVPTAARHFCSAKILAPSRASQVCRTPDQQPLKSTNQRPTGKLPAPGSPRVPEGPRSLCLGKSPEKTLPKGFLWATSSRRLDTALLCAAKKRGVELPGWQVSARTSPWSLDHGSSSQKNPLEVLCQNQKI